VAWLKPGDSRLGAIAAPSDARRRGGNPSGVEGLFGAWDVVGVGASDSDVKGAGSVRRYDTGITRKVREYGFRRGSQQCNTRSAVRFVERDGQLIGSQAFQSRSPICLVIQQADR
jgi:hypothetical protein